MSTALVTLTNKLAAKLDMGDGTGLIETLKATAFKGQVSDAQMTALMVVANQYGLNPWTKEIYAFPDKNNGIVPVVGVDGWSRIINEHPQFDGLDFKQTDDACTCIIHRKDRSHPISVTEYASECKRETGPWKSHPKRMLRHKALIQAARLAFGYTGIYDQDEAERIVEVDMGNINRETGEITPQPRPELPPCDDKKIDRWFSKVESGDAPANELMAFAEGRHTLTPEQKARINEFVAKHTAVDAKFVREMEGAEQ